MESSYRKSANKIFFSYVIVGVAYCLLLIILAGKALPGFFMQFLFLMDAIFSNPHTVLTIIENSTFIQTVVIGTISLILLAISIKGIIKSADKYARLKNVLKQNNTESIVTFNSQKLLVFTAGLFTPKVYISSQLRKNLSKSQMQAVLLHEFSHVNDYDPLRKLIIELINNITPVFPYKKELANLYSTAVELKCDNDAESILGEKRSIVEALYTMLASPKCAITEDLSVNFANIPERIPVLVGIQKYNYKFANILSMTLLFFAVSLPVVVLTAHFYSCEHITECFKEFVSNRIERQSKYLSIEHTAMSSDSYSKNMQ